MADILIRGMEMPNDGRKHNALLQFLGDGKCQAIVEYSKSYDDRSVKVFEAVSLPEGHGRLIDADYLDVDEVYTTEYGFQRVVWADLIDSAPTIVPAEEGADDGT